MAATIRVTVPESFKAILNTQAVDEQSLERWSLEAMVIEAYREGLISRGKIGELLGLSFYDREGWLKEREVPYLYDEEELKEERKALDRHLSQ